MPASPPILVPAGNYREQQVASGIEPAVVLRSIADVPSPLGCELVAERLRRLRAAASGRNLARIVLPGSARN